MVGSQSAQVTTLTSVILSSMTEELQKSIKNDVKLLFDVEAKVVLTRPEEKHGDYATNVALQLAKPTGKNPREIADQLSVKLRETLADSVSEVSVAGPGFINLKLNDASLVSGLTIKPAQSLAGKTVVAEYSDPNPFKVLHAGHFYTSVVGDAIANLMQNAGATVHRVNFGGDVGLHVAKAMWAIITELGGENSSRLIEIPEAERSEWMTNAYVKGTGAYSDDEAAKTEITALNKRIYEIHSSDDYESEFAKIYWTCREWSYQYFEAFYSRIGTKFDKYYPESETAPVGLQIVREQQSKGVYKDSDGAVVFEGEPHGLHTRVFINSEGLPTYEAKDVGLIMMKWNDYKFDKSVVITANDIDEYMKVVLKSIEQFRPDLVNATTHLTHGMVKLPGGVKMSSRLGNITRAVDVLEATEEANQHQNPGASNETSLGAIKYAFLKHRMGGDLIYDPKDSVSLEGNSGPYLQYAHARAVSILQKAEAIDQEISGNLEVGERTLVRKLTEFTEVIDQATTELMPHHICTYLYELAQVFNRFYENNRVIDDPRQNLRISLVSRYAKTLKQGLQLLGIAAPERM